MSLKSGFNNLSQHPMYRAGHIVGMAMGKSVEAKSMFMNVLKTGGSMLGDMVQKIANTNVLIPVNRAMQVAKPTLAKLET